MKRFLFCMLAAMLSILLMVSCGGGETGGNSDFDTNNVTLLSAYNEAQELGFEGTLEEFIAMISGKDGANGKDGITPTVEISEDGYWVINGQKTDTKAQGEKGDTGASGNNGKDGKDGVQGVGIKTVAFDENGDLLITFTDNSTQTVEMPKTQEQTHSFGEWKSFSVDSSIPCDERLFYRTCADCNLGEFKKGSPTDHKFETVTTKPTCTDGGYDTKTCSTCGKIEITNETPISDHIWKDNYSYDNSFHWIDCNYCDAEKEKAEHTTDESGYCTVCDKPVGATEGIIYEISSDGAYASVVGYDGIAVRVKIADMYEGVPVTELCDEVFKGKNIVSVIIPNSVTSIGNSAFSSCSSLTSVVIGDSVTSIGSSAFYYCTNLTSVVIGDSVTSIGERAFSSCYSLKSVTIPDSVTSIGSYAFASCGSLTSVVIGDSVKSIGSSAFYYCTNLTSVVIPDSVTIIGSSAFYYCRSLTRVTIPDSVTSIGEGAFSYCNSALYTEYNYGKYVGDSENPYSVLIELTNKNFTTYDINEKTKTIAYGVFADCGRLYSIMIPDSVTTIGSSAFSGCTNLTSVVIGDSVTSIGYEAFYYCDSLTSVTIPDSVTSIGSYAFADCYSLTSVTIGNSVTSIGDYAFFRCYSLTSVTIGNSVESIGNYAFYNCSSLTSVVIGDSVTSIGGWAFYSCDSLTSIKYRGTEVQWKAISKAYNWDDYTGNYTITYNYEGE